MAQRPPLWRSHLADLAGLKAPPTWGATVDPRPGNAGAYRGPMYAEWITLREAAALAGLSPRCVYDLCREGIIRAQLVRGRWRVDRVAFEPLNARA